jgi:hypothetical protein
MSNKIWLYQTNRLIEVQEQKVLETHLASFAEKWQAHGKNLQAKFWFHNPFLLICEVDEAVWGASGCSIDGKVRFLKELGERFDVDFFVRMKTILEMEGGHYTQVDFSEVSTESGPKQVFNPTVLSSDKIGLLFTAIEDSPMKRLFTT